MSPFSCRAGRVLLFTIASVCASGCGEERPTSTDSEPPSRPGVDAAFWQPTFDYADEAEFESEWGNEPGGSRLRPSGRFPQECIPMLVNWDADLRAMRYDYWNRAADPTGEQTLGMQCADSDPNFSISVAYGRRFDPPLPRGDQVWLRMVSREGTTAEGFSIGSGSDGGGIYKFVLEGWENTSDLFGVQAVGPSRFDFRLRWLGLLRAGVSDECGIHAHPGVGEWHTYVYGYDASEGLDRTRIQIYMDGDLVCDEIISLADPGGLLNIRPGWNMNSGPIQEQHRWIREFGVYLERPPID